MLGNSADIPPPTPGAPPNPTRGGVDQCLRGNKVPNSTKSPLQSGWEPPQTKTDLQREGDLVLKRSMPNSAQSPLETVFGGITTRLDGGGALAMFENQVSDSPLPSPQIKMAN